MSKASETGAHRALVQNARLSISPGTVIERYDTADGFTSMPVARMTYRQIEHRKMEARLMHGLAERRRVRQALVDDINQQQGDL